MRLSIAAAPLYYGSNMHEIVLAADHNGFEMKRAVQRWLEAAGYTVIDAGARQLDPKDDYPDIAFAAGRQIAADPARRGIMFCGSGVGMAVAANKVCGILAATIHDPSLARAAQRDDNINVLALGADYIDLDTAKSVIDAWLQTPFSGAVRHRRRIKKIGDYEQAHGCSCDSCRVIDARVDRPEVVPAILRPTFAEIATDWNAVVRHAEHVQIDITDGIFAGTGTFRDLIQFRQLPAAQKIELHLMVHDPLSYRDAIRKLAPARCVFHVEAFPDARAVQDLYDELRRVPGIALGLAINPTTPLTALDPVIDAIDYILFMGYEPGQANQPLQPDVLKNISTFQQQHGHVPIAVDGHVTRKTIPDYLRAGAKILCANTAIFGIGDPAENIRILRTIALTISAKG
ncbi:MAG: hypothetical protein COT71_04565 [Candidatus Andersenbacteria bacterium CG10_big_fil_rev_8_21_14_0_10_54_11]|uniref:Ribose-5-phosphate isomerase n=1 Tax=Candidatus Andersenbacteria bacterium CG10_big_fil_rev_8_21_14_0_10_54_11 TaxID=1974485 RepID=A0A2M6WY60_9BACT|nr:MAG: hypothetical protein COT71_04565 [Candidatus Andersenbacteria bacterium CG10_big_fil_rev_8_21_14_0_10_54_11]